MNKINKTESEWKALLSEDQFLISRKKHTEPAFSGAFWDCKKTGVYSCVCCGTVLFSSDAKYDSGTGWPSFYQAVQDERISIIEDRSFGMKRLEAVCAHCDGHLGHLFHDGPDPTGKRYCINSASLSFKKSDRSEIRNDT